MMRISKRLSFQPLHCVSVALLFLVPARSISFAEQVFIPQFQDATEKAGLSFRHESGTEEKDYIIEVNGSGLGLFDYDNDGDLDIYFVNASYLGVKDGQKPPMDQLFRNEGNWKFTNVTNEAGLGCTEWGYGCSVADFDNDGDLDLFVTNWGPNCLYRNNGDGTFTDIAAQAGVAEEMWGGSSAFGDYDLDGDLDLYVTNYLDFDPAVIPKRGERASCNLEGDIMIHCGPKGLTPIPDSFYRNNGDGTFTDVSEESGIRAVENGFGLGVFFLDYDLDGYPDIYVSNDVSPNYLFRNNGDGSFEEMGLIAGVSYNRDGDVQSGMGVECGDLNHNSYEDIVVMNYAQDYNTVYKNEGDGFFTDISREANLYSNSYHQLSWSLILVDVEYDGDLDIFISNGHVIPQVDLTDAKLGYKQKNQLLMNDGKCRFQDISDRAGDAFQVKLSSRGCALGDLDGDGDQDIVVSNMDCGPTIYENSSGAGNHWIGIHLTGTKSNRNAFGSWVTVKTEEREISKYHRGSFGYASQSELTLRFGLGKSSEVEFIKVKWPTGDSELFKVNGINTIHQLTEGRGISAAKR